MGKHLKNLKCIVILVMYLGAPMAQAQEKKDVEENVKSTSEPVAKTEDKGHSALSIAEVFSASLNGVHADKDTKAYLGAILFELGANQNIAFETGLLIMERQYQIANADYLLQQNVRRLHIPLNLKLWWRDIAALSLGPYMAFAINGVDTYKVIYNSDTNNLQTPAEDFSEYGFEVGVSFKLPINDKFGIFMQGRYYVPYDTLLLKKTNSIFGLFGVQYKFQAAKNK